MRYCIDLCLAFAVLAAWLACLGYLRLGEPLDRLHCVTFSNIVGMFMLVIAAFLNDGLASRPLKLLLIWVVVILGGAVTSHATGRAIHTRANQT